MSGFLWQWGGPDRYPHTAPAPSATVLRASCHCVVFVHVRVHCFSKVDVAAIHFVSQRFLTLSCLPACLSSVFSRVNVALIYFVSQSESSTKCRTARWDHKSLLNPSLAARMAGNAGANNGSPTSSAAARQLS